MKKATKNIYIICIITVAILLLSACGASNSSYRFADNWNIEADYVDDAVERVKVYAKPEASSDYNDVLISTKEVVASTISYSEFLDWSKFEALREAFELDISANDVSSMSPEEIHIFSSYIAFYDDVRDRVYLLPQFYEAADEQRIYCLIHEVIHALVPNRKSADDFNLVEGLVDWLALRVCTDLGLDVKVSYQEAILCLRILMDIYGEETVVQAICEDSIVNLIDESTKAGMAEKLNTALSVAHGHGDAVADIREATYVELDILSHAAKKEGTDIRDWIDAVAQIYGANGIKLDTSPFK